MCAELYAVGQPFFLRTPHAQVQTARELMRKLIAQPATQEPAADETFEPEPEPEPEPEGGGAAAKEEEEPEHCTIC